MPLMPRRPCYRRYGSHTAGLPCPQKIWVFDFRSNVEIMGLLLPMVVSTLSGIDDSDIAA